MKHYNMFSRKFLSKFYASITFIKDGWLKHINGLQQTKSVECVTIQKYIPFLSESLPFPLMSLSGLRASARSKSEPVSQNRCVTTSA